MNPGDMELDDLREQLAAAREAVGAGWFAGGVSLAEGIERKTAALERSIHDQARLLEARDAALTLAYPKALQAAAGLVFRYDLSAAVVDMEDEDEVAAAMEALADVILELTEEQIEAVDAAQQPERKREVVFWSCEQVDEELHHTDADDAVESYLDDVDAIDWEDADATVTVYGYARMPVSAHVRSGMEGILESIDEELGDPNNTRRIHEMVTPGMENAFQALVDAIEKDYQPWACEVVEKREVNVLAWVREHAAHWLPVAEGEVTP